MNPIHTIFIDFGNVIAFFDHERTTRKLQAYCRHPYERLYRSIYHPTRFDDLETGQLAAIRFAQVSSDRLPRAIVRAPWLSRGAAWR